MCLYKVMATYWLGSLKVCPEDPDACLLLSTLVDRSENSCDPKTEKLLFAPATPPLNVVLKAPLLGRKALV